LAYHRLLEAPHCRDLDVFKARSRDPQLGIFEQPSEPAVVPRRVLRFDEQAETLIEGQL
jgi:hypothetical protein